MMFLTVVGKNFAALLVRHQVLLAELLPAAHRLQDVGRARMRLEIRQARLSRDRTVPGHRHRLAKLPHVWLNADGSSCSSLTRRIEMPPSEVAACHLLPGDGRLGERVLNELFLELLRHKAVEGVRAAEHVPAEVRLRRPFGQKRLRLEQTPIAVLRIRDVEVERRVHAFGAI